MTKSSQLALINGDALTEQDVYSAIDTVISNLYDTGDMNEATKVLTTLNRIGNVAGHAKAKLLYGMHQWWQENGEGKSFEDYIASKSVDAPESVTIDRYITVQEKIESGEIPASIAMRPMRDLIPIAKTIAQGFEIGERNWIRLIKATSNSEISDILRSVKGKAPRKSSLQISWERKGDLVVWKNNKRTFIGFLDKDVYLASEDGRKAIDRILDTAGVIRK
jgi:hypothetical protein